MAHRNAVSCFLLLSVLALSAVGHARLVLSYRSCGDDTDVIQPVDLSIDPYNVDPGTNITITTSLEVNDVIESGLVNVKAESNGQKVFEENHDICDFFDDHYNTSCPIQPGSYTNVEERTATVDPFGDVFTVTTTAFGGNDTDTYPMICVQFIASSRAGW